MAKSLCPHCSAPNRAGEMFCDACGGRMATVTSAASSTAPVADVPGHSAPAAATSQGNKAEAALIAVMVGDVMARRQVEARAAAFALGSVAALAAVRAGLLPLMMTNIPPEKIKHLAAFMSPTVLLTQWLLAAMFAAACVFALSRPLAASLGALVLFLAYAIPDVYLNPSFIDGGYIGKGVTLAIVARAVFAGVMHHTLAHESRN